MIDDTRVYFISRLDKIDRKEFSSLTVDWMWLPSRIGTRTFNIVKKFGLLALLNLKVSSKIFMQLLSCSHNSALVAPIFPSPLPKLAKTIRYPIRCRPRRLASDIKFIVMICTNVKLPKSSRKITSGFHRSNSGQTHCRGLGSRPDKI